MDDRSLSLNPKVGTRYPATTKNKMAQSFDFSEASAINAVNKVVFN